MQWKLDNKAPDTTPIQQKLQSVEGVEKTFSLSSQIDLDVVKWKKISTVTCQSNHDTTEFTKSVSICSLSPASSQAVGVHVVGPSLQELQENGQVTITCLLIGQNLEDFSITWKVGGTKSSENVNTESKQYHNNGTETIRSFVNITAKAWHEYSQVSCEGKHRCSSQGYEKNISKCRDPKPPSVKIIRPTDSELLESNTATLVCLVSGFYPSDIIVYWEKDGHRLPLSHFISNPPGKDTRSSIYSMSSGLNVSRSEWDQESIYSCVVKHESSEELLKSTIEDVFASVTPSRPSAMLLQGSGELVCLVYGFSPATINITWLLNDNTELLNYNSGEPHRGPKGKFTIQSRLRLFPVDWLPGAVYTCRVTHSTVTLALNISKPEILEEGVYFDENSHDPIIQDLGEDTWYMACTFLLLFFVALFYGILVTLIKIK